MSPVQLLRHRLRSHCLSATSFTDPANLVRWLGAVQAQDYLGSLWAVGLRVRNATESLVERAIAKREIVRTWPMRGTLHFVGAEDVRWMLELMTPRVVASSAGRLAKHYGLDSAALARCRKATEHALEDGRPLTRDATYQALERAGISTTAGRGLHIAWRMAHDGLICFGPRQGKQHTFVLLDAWVPDGKRMARDEALAELARRYFTSRGPATVHDFAWWSGLLLTDAAEGLAMMRGEFVPFELAGLRYWGPPAAETARSSTRAYLLPAFDEYTVAYRHRGALVAPAHSVRAKGVDLLRPVIVVNGRVVGSWTRARNRSSVRIELSPFTRLGIAARRAVARAAREYGEFLELGTHAS